MISAATRTWAILVLLTLTAMGAGGAIGSAVPGLAGTALLIVITGFKAVEILRHFLELKRATPGWQALFYLYLALLGGLIFAAYALSGRLPGGE